MQVKHNHLCMLTNRMTTCFVFSEFPTLFALSRDAFDQLLEDYPLYPVEHDAYCSFCESQRDVKTLTGFDDTTFFSDVHICSSCYDKMKHKIEENA